MEDGDCRDLRGDSTMSDFVLAFDFGGTKIALATADAAGEVQCRMELPTQAADGAVQALNRAIGAGTALVDQAVEGGGRLVGVGVSTMGITLEDRVLMAPNVAGWETQAIPAVIRHAFHTDAVRVANDVKAAARAELWRGELTGVETGLYVNLGTGIAAVLIVGGRIVAGAHGAAGEIGYNLRHLHEEEGAAAGEVPLEQFVGGGAIRARIARRFGDATPSDIFGAVRTNPQARAFVGEILSEVAFHITNLTIALDPGRVVVGGGIMRSADLILPPLRDHVARFVPFPPEVVAGRFLLDGGLIGAVALALDVAGDAW